jgi:hypothetical protein
MKFVAIACLCGGALAAVACADGPGGLTSPSATSAARLTGTALSAAPRSGELHVTKECGDYHGNPGEFCTITSSNVKAIEVGSRVVYARSPTFPTLDTDVVLDTPGPGNNQAFGHCTLDLTTGLGLCTFSGGTGKFEGFTATAHVSPPTAKDPENWHWFGTYGFNQGD